MDRPGAVAELRSALTAFASDYTAGEHRWCVALSGGPDSLALAAAAAALLPTTALIVDHRLQPGSHEVASTAKEQALAVGCVAAETLCVDVIEHDYSEHFPEIHIPVLAIWGEADRLTKVGPVLKRLGRLPRLRTIMMPRTGHMPMIERPEKTLWHLERFLVSPP